jgi:hypothetical protein
MNAAFGVGPVQKPLPMVLTLSTPADHDTFVCSFQQYAGGPDSCENCAETGAAISAALPETETIALCADVVMSAAVVVRRAMAVRFECM